MTLAFIGHVPEAQLGPAADAVRAAAARLQPFDVVLDEIGHFPERGRPNVVWLGVGAGAEDLGRLGAAVRAALRERGVPFDDKPFRSHVTLARVQRDLAAPDERLLRSALATLDRPSLGFRADTVHLVESRLSPKGPRYSSLEAIPLGAADAPHPRERRERIMR